jgi:hypothetical protein
MKRIQYTLTILFFTLAPMLSRAAVLTDPLGGVGVNGLVSNLIRAVLGITGSVALLMFVWGGFQWLFSAGEADRVKKGKDTIKWAVLGIVVILTAYILVNSVVSILESGTIA